MGLINPPFGTGNHPRGKGWACIMCYAHLPDPSRQEKFGTTGPFSRPPKNALPDFGTAGPFSRPRKTGKSVRTRSRSLFRPAPPTPSPYPITRGGSNKSPIRDGKSGVGLINPPFGTRAHPQIRGWSNKSPIRDGKPPGSKALGYTMGYAHLPYPSRQSVARAAKWSRPRTNDVRAKFPSARPFRRKCRKRKKCPVLRRERFSAKSHNRQ